LLAPAATYSSRNGTSLSVPRHVASDGANDSAFSLVHPASEAAEENVTPKMAFPLE
jgi:hypothetical protein